MSMKRSDTIRSSTVLFILFSIAAIGFRPACTFAAATGTIVGTVNDSSGAPVPGVDVTVTQEATQAIRKATTDQNGSFQFPLLDVGPYTLRAEKPGFQVSVQKGLVLQVDQNLTVPVTLSVGTVNQEVTVVGNAAGVDLVKATLSEVVDARRIVDLPLNGRDPLQLQNLMPGTGPDTNNVSHGQGQHGGIVVNGNRPASNYYLLDGVDYVDSYLAVAPTFPAPDALQEFSMNTSAFSAEYGRSAGALVNAVTKSGTNEWHGDAFEFFRNDKLNANNFFANRAGVARPPYKLNQFGGTLGGPIRKDKTFIFGYFQQTERRQSETVTVNQVLSAQQRPDLNPLGANFSDICPSSSCPKDPRTNAPFPNNTIPLSRIDPVALNLIKRLMPLPNNGLSYTWSGFRIGNNDSLSEPQFVVRLDHSFSEKDRIFGRYFFNHDNITGSGGNLPTLPHMKEFRNNTVGIGWTHDFSPTLLNQALVGMNRLYHYRAPTESIAWRDFGGAPTAGPPDRPGDLFTNVSGSINASGDGVFQQPRTTFQYTDTLSWVRGQHSLRIGGEYRTEATNRFEDYITDPSISFNGQFSGYGLADLLLGLPNNFQQDNEVRSELRHRSPSLFITDNWKAASNLTLDMGFRWEPYLPPVDNLNDQICFDPTFTSKSSYYPTAPPGITFPGGPINANFGAGDPGCPRNLVGNHWKNVAPRFGFAWDPFKKGKTSVRGAYGIFWDQIRLIAYNRFSTSTPFSYTATIPSPGNVNNNFAPSLAGTSAFTNSGQTNPYPFDVPRTPEQRAAFSPLYGGRWPTFSLEVGMSPHWNQGYIQEYNFSIQHEVMENTTLMVAYVGNTARHLYISRENNPAIPLPFTVQTFDQQLADTNTRRRLNYLQCLNGQGASQPCYGPFALNDNNAFSNYNSLQVTFNRRYSKGITLLASYVWAKYIDLVSYGAEGGSGPRNPFNLFLDRGLSNNDVRHRFVASYIWQLPQADRYKNSRMGVLVNGWEVNGIVTAQTGTPFTVTSGTDRSLTAIGNDTADWQFGQPTTLDTGRSRNQLINQYFNTAAFTLAAPGTFGTTGRNTMIGPGLLNFDFAIFKNFLISERLGRIQFRNEYFNIFNNVNLLNPNSSVNNGSAFGTITGARDPRYVQFGLKWIF
jgi:Carboxypeptidase regulatory-like domain